MPPADEKTWRCQKTLHIVFAATTLLMLVATVWMTWKDHNREWKGYQRAGVNAESKLLAWRADQAQPVQFGLSLAEAEAEVKLSRISLPKEEAVEQFQKIASEVEDFNYERLNEAFAELKPLVAAGDEAVAASRAARKAADDAQAAYRVAQQNASNENPVSEETAANLATLQAAASEAAAEAEAREADALAKSDELEPTRRNMLDEMRRIIGRVRYYEDIAVRQRKVASAKYDEAKATRGLAVSTGKSTVEAQQVVDQRKKLLDEWLTKVETIETQRLALDKILATYTEPETEAVKARDRVKADVARLEAALDERELTGAREILNLPIVSAFNAPLKVNQIWLPELTLYNNFKHVARFDRCTTCHMFMNKSKPGAPTEPGFPQEEILTLALNTPSSAPDESESHTLRKLYGMDIAEEGLFDPNDATIRMVWTQVLDEQNEIVTSLAAQSGLQMADVIVRINGQQVRPSQKGGLSVTSAEVARDLLLNPPEWGKPIELTIRRGFPQPFQTHPRLDLYMADSSPHPMQKFGCTICHEGQGSATEFKWASHTPNSISQMTGFKKQGWFDNHHWIFPMFPERFTEASCLKCHHTVTELEPSERFPDPPAPKLVKGYNLIREYGCFGCHEINGYDGPDKRIGPDMRLEPNYFAAAAQLLQDPGLTPAERSAAERLVTHPGDTETRRKLYDWLLDDYLSVARALQTEHASRGNVLTEDQVKLVEAVIDDPKDRAARQTLATEIQSGKLAIAGDTKGSRPQPARLADGWQALAALLKDSDTPGDMRKVGPSLRHVAKKVDNDYLYAWIKKPSDLRPDTRMPQFFGLHDHLAKDPEHEDHVAYETAQKFEPLEIRSMTHYLMKASQEFEYLQPEESITEAPSAERGKALFESRGCLACHKQTEDFPQPDAVQGPNLTLVGAKFANRPGEKTVDWGKAKDWGEGKRWLYTWLRKPSHYNPRTRMPDVKLEPIKTDKEGEDGAAGSSVVTDPAADIVEYLAQKRKGDPEPGKMPEVDVVALDELLTEHLGKSFTQTQVADYLQKGIHDRDRSSVKVDEIELLSDGSDSDAELLDKKLMYLGRRSIGKYGCSGCHDIPGFEDAKPIGAALADWGRKDPSKLAFEHISQYVAHKHQAHAHAEANAKHGSGDDHHAHDGDAHHGGHDSHSMSAVSDEPENLRRERRDYLEHMLLSHHRMGFLWQKITEPRSYDYKMAKNKPYNDRLRMPKFPFKDDEIEAIMTFVLGLVAEPPRAQYVFQPDRDTKAIIEGRKVLATFNCAGCHQMQRPKWNIEYAPGSFADQAPEFKDFAFLRPQVSSDDIEQSLRLNSRGRRTAQLAGEPALNAKTGEIDRYWWSVEDDERVTEEDLPDIEGEVYEAVDFHITDPVVLDGHVFDGRGAAVRVKLGDIQQQYPNLEGQQRWPWHGGDLGRWIFRSALANERATANPNATPRDTWNWLPPSLVGEGDKVQTKWLHDFLIDPHVIRPAAILRMPKFTLSSDEASKLVDYFAALDRASYPYVFSPRQRAAHMASAAAHYEAALPEDQRGKRTRMGDAMKLATGICSQCHLMGDFDPGGNPRVLGPQFSDVHERLRPDWVRSWIANPTRHIWYTGMPVNFPAGKKYTEKELQQFNGDSIQHIDAVTDLLMNWQKENTRSIKAMVPKKAAAGGDAADEKPDEAAEDGDS